MSPQLIVALFDAAVGVYFVVYALHHENLDKSAVMVTPRKT